MKEKTEKYRRLGSQALEAGRLTDALWLFSKALELDPLNTGAAFGRGEAEKRLSRASQADADNRQAGRNKTSSGPDAPGAENRRKSPPGVKKIDVRLCENLYDNLLLDDGKDELDFHDNLYDYVFTDDLLESDNLLVNLTADERTKKSGVAAIIEYLDGRRQEVPWTYLFEPTDDELTLVHAEGAEPEIVSLDQLSRIRLSRPPAGFARNKDDNCHVEVIETCDGNIFYESIHPVQVHKHILYGFSTKNDTRFKYTLIPVHNIKKRLQRRHLGQILVDRSLITSVGLKNALDEFNMEKQMKFGRLLAAHANLLYSAVEAEIQAAYREPGQKLKIGEILLNAGLVNQEQIDSALKHQKKIKDKKLGHFLVEKGILQEKDVCMALAEKFRIPFVDLRSLKGSKKVIAALPPELIKKLKVLPLAVENDTLVVATLLPEPAPICDVIYRHSPYKDVKFVLVQPSHLNNVIRMLFQPD